MKRITIAALLLCAALLLSGCRTRLAPLGEPTTAAGPPPETAQQAVSQPAATAAQPESAAPPETEPDTPAPPEEEPSAELEEDPESERRAYDPDASAELTPEADTPVALPQENAPEAGAAEEAGGSQPAARAVEEERERTVTETVPAEAAEQLAAAQEGAEAESALQYYQSLLSSRLSELFECKRLDLYWETETDHTTVHKSSLEHKIIQLAGAYDVSAKLLADALTVDDGWIARKNPGAVVKCVDAAAMTDADALRAELAARPEWAELDAVKNGRVILLSRALLDTPEGQTAAAVYLARALYPSVMEDVDPDEALKTLFAEAGRAAPAAAADWT